MDFKELSLKMGANMYNASAQPQMTEDQEETYGFIFNLDGAVIDTASHRVAAWQKVLVERNIKRQPQEIVTQCYGSGSEIACRLMGDRLNEQEIGKIVHRQEELFQKDYRANMQLLQGLKKFLDDAKSLNIPMALTCDSSLALMNFLIEGLALKSYFKVIVGAEDVDRGRPSPDILLKASLRLGLLPEECVVFDSSESGIEAAQRAGVRVLTIQPRPDTTKKKPSNLVQKIADYRILQPALAYSYSKLN